MVLAPWSVLDVLALALGSVLSYLVLDRAWRRWNTETTAQTIAAPQERTRIGTLAWIVIGWSFIALLVMMARLAVLPDEPGWQTAVEGSGWCSPRLVAFSP